jgi:Phage integrase family
MQEEEWLPETFLPGDIAKFAQAKPQKRAARRARLLVLTLADTGLRLSEALGLRWKDVDLDTLLLTVVRKGREERKIPFSMELRKVLYRTNRSGGDGFIFGTNQGTHLSPRDARRDVSKLCVQLHINRPCPIHQSQLPASAPGSHSTAAFPQPSSQSPQSHTAIQAQYPLPEGQAGEQSVIIEFHPAITEEDHDQQRRKLKNKQSWRGPGREQVEPSPSADADEGCGC